MASQQTIAETILIGDLSVGYSANYQSLGVLFGQRLATTAPTTIAIVTDALRWQNEGDSTDDTLRGVANYLYWLTGRFGLQAQYALGGGGGTVVPGGVVSVPIPLQFIVDASTSFMIDGQSSVTISGFIGYNLLFTRGGIPQSTVVTEPTYYTWNKTTGLFTINIAAVTGELFQIYAI